MCDGEGSLEAAFLICELLLNLKIFFMKKSCIKNI